MRICDAFYGVVIAAGFLAAGQAAAFDAKSLDPATAPRAALQQGLDLYRKGEKATAFEALNFAAEKGDPIAQWKAGQMLADGDGIKQDDVRAYEMFSDLADAHAEDNPGEPNAQFVSRAFVALGGYLRYGIPNSEVKADPARARQIYGHAALIYGDAEAQFNLARMLFSGEGGDADPIGAVKWAKQAADKCMVAAQALLGHILFEGADGVDRQPIRGLSYLMLARTRAKPDDRWVIGLQEEAVSVATEAERRKAYTQAETWRSLCPKR
jgi:TPR repeat protein